MMQIPPTVKIFAGLTRRLFAFIIDVIVMNIAFLLIYLIFRLIGYNYSEFWLIFLIIFIMYFSFLDSILLKGKTPGKLQFNIQVVDLNGNAISSVKALLRSIYIAIIYFNYHLITALYGLLIDILPEFIVVAVITLVVAFLLFSITVFAAFHPYHQGVHDVLAGTIVIVRDRFSEEALQQSYSVTRLTASYFLTFTLTLLAVLIAVVVSLVL